jgi:sulfur carrier protein
MRDLGIDPEASGVAVALNSEVVTRRRWSETTLTEGDRLEVIRATQGG